MDNLKLIVESSDVQVGLIALIRRHTGLPIGQIRRAILTQTPVLDVTPHHNEYDEFARKTEPLLRQLEAESCNIRLIVDGSEESVEFVRNAFRQWAEIQQQIQNEDDERWRDRDASRD
ncbi:MAG: hypothetical protein AAF657_35095 [Acidobacteriota bacterium]